MKPLRIFVGTTEIAGYYSHLSDALAHEGHDVEFVQYAPNPFRYAVGASPFLVRVIRGLLSVRERLRSRRTMLRSVSAHATGAVIVLAQVLFLLRCLPRFDVFIFGFGTSLVWRNADLPVLKLFKKRIVFNMSHGSESRPPFINGALLDSDGHPRGGLRQMMLRTHAIRRSIRFIEKYADVVIGAPFTSHMASKPMVNHFAIGWPFRGPTVDPRERDERRSAPVRIVHAPSNPIVKGSEIVRATVQALQARGHQIDYVELTNRSNAEVLEALSDCDFVIDELYSDAVMAGLATEAAWFGKPSIVGGYRLNELAEHIAPEMYPPVETCQPDSLEGAVLKLITDPGYRAELGRRAQRFVHERWGAKPVAERYLRIIRGTAPDSWWFDPRSVLHLEGMMRKDMSQRLVRQLVDVYGVEALQLSHRPELEAAFLKVAFSPAPDISTLEA